MPSCDGSNCGACSVSSGDTNLEVKLKSLEKINKQLRKEIEELKKANCQHLNVKNLFKVKTPIRMPFQLSDCTIVKICEDCDQGPGWANALL